jgi:hypothetical protein
MLRSRRLADWKASRGTLGPSAHRELRKITWWVAESKDLGKHAQSIIPTILRTRKLPMPTHTPSPRSAAAALVYSFARLFSNASQSKNPLKSSANLSAYCQMKRCPALGYTINSLSESSYASPSSRSSGSAHHDPRSRPTPASAAPRAGRTRSPGSGSSSRRTQRTGALRSPHRRRSY